MRYLRLMSMGHNISSCHSDSNSKFPLVIGRTFVHDIMFNQSAEDIQCTGACIVFFKFYEPRCVYCDKVIFAFQISMFEKTYSMKTVISSQEFSLIGGTSNK